MKSGRAGTMTHDYKRNGTIDLFAAMNVATGEVLTDLRKGHTGADVLRFFKQIDASVPRGLGVHVVLDNLSAHSTSEIAKWLAHKDRRRWHLHYTPTSSSWVNLIERWFKELTDKRLRRGTFTSVADLTAAITTWAEHWNTNPSHSSGKPPPKTSSPKFAGDDKHSTSSIHRRTTRTTPTASSLLRGAGGACCQPCAGGPRGGWGAPDGVAVIPAAYEEVASRTI